MQICIYIIIERKKDSWKESFQKKQCTFEELECRGILKDEQFLDLVLGEWFRRNILKTTFDEYRIF